MALADRLLARETQRRREHLEVLVGAQEVKQAWLLRAVADAASHADAPRVGRDQAGADTHQRAFPGAVLADDRHRLAGRDPQRAVLEHGSVAVALADSVCLQRRRAAGSGLRRRA
jgi:hypothetical protein